MNRFLQQLVELSGAHPYDQIFIDKITERITRRCSLVPVQVHKRYQAQERLEQAAKEAIVEVYHEEFPDAWFPIRVKKNWPFANCIIRGNEAFIEFSFSPETDALAGGIVIEPVKITVQRAPNILTRAAQAIFKRKPGDDRETELAPVGTPTGKRAEPDMRRPGANFAAKPSAGPARAEPKTESISKPKPARANMRKS